MPPSLNAFARVSAFLEMTRSTAVLAGILCAAAQQPPPPGALFDLSTFNLQLPVSNGNGGVVIVKQPDLATYSSQYFYTNATDNSMTFFAPVNGATTSGSKYPRSELRQLPNFDFTGHHVLNVTMTVRVAPPTTGAITIGQVHRDGVSGSCSIVSEFEWQAVSPGSSTGHLVNHFRDQACSGKTATVAGTVELGERFSYSLVMDGQTMHVWTSKGALAPYTYSWYTTEQQYFKAGDYVQESGTSSTDGGVVAIHAITSSHSAA